MSRAGNNRYKIGAVERLTGVPASSIRIWERRHGAVIPERSSAGTRYYSNTDVERLKLIRELTEAGDAISEVAGLDEQALRARRNAFRAPISGAAHVERVLLVGYFSESMRAELKQRGGFRDVVHCELLEDAPGGEYSPDVLVVNMASLHRDDAARLHALRRQTGAAALIVVYRFASRQVLCALDAPEIELVRAPAQIEDLLLRLQRAGSARPAGSDALGDLLAEPSPAQRFSPRQLARVPELDSTVKCECPQHLADLITALQSFEQFSAECESRSEEDAVLHARLYRGAAHCRAVMEGLLAQTLAAEGLLEELS